MKPITIGGLSKRTGVNIETIRYYERIGVLPGAPRTSGGHRLYDEDHLKRLTFVRRSRELGFPLEEVRGLLRMVDGDGYSCDEVKALTLDHLADIRRKIADLKNRRRSSRTWPHNARAEVSLTAPSSTLFSR